MLPQQRPAGIPPIAQTESAGAMRRLLRPVIVLCGLFCVLQAAQAAGRGTPLKLGRVSKPQLYLPIVLWHGEGGMRHPLHSGQDLALRLPPPWPPSPLPARATQLRCHPPYRHG